MRKFGIFSGTIFISILVAGLYGVLHDQVTYSISPEYFTKFKYGQFGFEPKWFGGHTTTVAVIGFLATWWFGMFIGVILGLTALIFKDYKTMRNAVKKAIGVTFCFALAASVSGFFYGKFVLTKTGVDWWLPQNLEDKNAFIIVGSIHNFSYFGGILGLIGGIFYLVRLNNLQKRRRAEIR